MRNLERLADEITKLAAHINAATAHWLGLIAEFDRREGWAAYGCKSCADWVAWRCSLAPNAARERVRVARRLEELPLLREAFERGELSYSKVRALTRLEEVAREEELLQFALHATASQLERTVRAYSGAVAAQADPAAAYEARFLEWTTDDDGTVRLNGRLPAEEGALVVAALEAVRERIDADRRAVEEEGHLVQPEPRGARRADALVALAEDRAAHERTTSSGGDRCQVVLHVEAEALAPPVDDPLVDGRVRCETEEGGALSRAAVRRICCDSSIVPMAERDGRTLSIGRKRRAIPPAIRRALRSRDRTCRFPGCCESRHVDAHHIEHWADGGATSLSNLVTLCRYHHRLVHEGGYGVRLEHEVLTFLRPDGRTLPPAPRLRRGDRGELCNRNRRRGVEATAATIVPRSAGERMDLGLAVDAVAYWTGVASAGTPPPSVRRAAAQPAPPDPPLAPA
jgi:hypothetical protein